METLVPVIFLGRAAENNVGQEARVQEMVESMAQAAIYVGRGHSESESLGGGERKETRKQYGSTISCIWGEAVHGMRILWRP